MNTLVEFDIEAAPRGDSSVRKARCESGQGRMERRQSGELAPELIPPVRGRDVGPLGIRRRRR